MAPPMHVGDVPGPLQTRHASGVRLVRQPRDPRSPRPRAPGAPRPRRARDGRPRGRGRAPAGHGSRSRPPGPAPGPGRPGTRRSNPGDGGTPRRPRPPSRPTRRPVAHAACRSAGVSSHRSASRRRASTPSSWPVASNAPAYTALSTGLTAEQLVGERLEPAQQRGLLSTPAQCGHGQLDQVRRSGKVLGGQRVADRLGPLAVLLVPRARPPVQVGNVLGLLVQQVRAQHVRKEVVVAIPPAAVVERDHEQVPALQRLQHGLPAVLAGDGIAQRAAQPVQDGGLQQEASGPARADAARPPRPGSRRCSGRPPRSRR